MIQDNIKRALEKADEAQLYRDDFGAYKILDEFVFFLFFFFFFFGFLMHFCD